MKKKSGPAKGTKYAARRARSQDEYGRSSASRGAGVGVGMGMGGGAGAGSGSLGGGGSLGAGGNFGSGGGPPPRRGLVLDGAMLRRSASTGDRSSPPSSSSSSCAVAIVSRDLARAPSHGAHIHHHRSALPPELGFSPTGRRGDGSEEGGAEAEREGGVPGGGLGPPGRSVVVDGLAMRHQHHGSAGGEGAESQQQQQQLNFPDVLQVIFRCSFDSVVCGASPSLFFFFFFFLLFLLLLIVLVLYTHAIFLHMIR